MNFKCKPIKADVVKSAPPNPDKKPSAYSAMTAPARTLSIDTEAPEIGDEKKARGRPRKADEAKERAMKASAAVKHLVELKPTAKQVSEWIKNRLTELNADVI